MGTPGTTHDVSLTTSGGTVYSFTLAKDESGLDQWEVTEAATFADRISEGTPSYTQTNPETDLVFSKNDWSGGMGLEKVDNNYTNRYWDGTNIDARYPKQVTLAPNLNALTVTTGGPGSNKVGSLDGYNAFCTFGGKLYCIGYSGTTTYVYKLDSSHWDEVLKDTAVYLTPRGLVTYGSYIIAHMKSKYHYSTDGAAWTAVTKDVDQMIVVRNTLWASHDATVFSTTDPTGSWSTTTTIGDSRFNISHLYEVDGTLFVAKPDGLWTFDRYGTQDNLTPEFRQVPAGENFKYGCIFKNMGVFSTFHDGILAMISGSLVDITPSVENTTTTISGKPIRGMCNGYNWIYATVMVEGGASTHTIVVLAGKLQQGEGGLEWVWHPLWYGTPSSENNPYHDSMTVAGSDEDTSMYADTNPRLWISTSNTTNCPGYFILPKGHLAPSEDTNSQYYFISPYAGYLYEPWWDGGFSDQDKAFMYISIDADQIVSGEVYIKVSYKIDTDTTWTDLTTITTSGVTKVDFASGTKGKKLKLRFTLYNSKGVAYTPVLNAYVLHAVLRPQARRVFNFGVIAGANPVGWNGLTLTGEKAATIAANLKTLRDEVYPVILTDWDSNQYTVQVKGPLAYKRVSKNVGEETETVYYVTAEEVIKASNTVDTTTVAYGCGYSENDLLKLWIMYR